MKNNRTFLEKLLDGAEVEWKPLKDILIRTKGTKITAAEMKVLHKDNAPLKIFAGGKTFALVNFEDIPEKDINKNPSIIVKSRGIIEFEYYDKPFSHKNEMWSYYSNDKNINIKYIYYILENQEPYFQNLGSKMQMPQIATPDTDKYLVPIPPLSVQTKIVKILDALTALTSELTSELILRRKQYEYYREKLLSEEELGKVGFEWRTLGDVAKIQRGASPRPISQYITDDPNGIPWIKIGDTSLDSKYIENTAQKITIEGAEKSRILKIGDFVMSNSMSYGRPYILKISGAIHDGWASISDFENILNSDFLYYYLSSNTVQSYWNGKINSSSVSNLNSDIIKSLPIPIPTLNIQIEIAKTLDKFETLTNSITDGLPLAIEQSQKRYEYYRELLLNFS